MAKKKQQKLPKGKLIVFEGGDATGKSTLCGELCNILKEKGIVFKSYHFPGKDENTLGGLVYKIHHEYKKSFGIDEIDHCSLQTLHIASHIDSIRKRIIPELKKGTWVVLDRFWWSTYVYGITSGISKLELDNLINLERIVWGTYIPDVAFHIDTEKPLRSDETYNKKWQKIRTEYCKLANSESNNYKVIHLTTSRDIKSKINVIERMKATVVSLHSIRGFNQQILIPNKIKISPLFEYYWQFACERQNVFFNRLVNKPAPWTNDPIIQKYKFTNAYRILDRVSQYLIKNVILKDEADNLTSEEKIFRILLFKLFNKIETWELLQSSLKNLHWSEFSYQKYDKILSDAMLQKRSIYSGAYIMTSGKSSFGKERKHQNHLMLLETMMKSNITEKVNDCNNMGSLYELLKSFPTIGNFLAYQYATDINYSQVTNFTEEEFVMAGPGAQDGIKKCFLSTGKYSNEDIIFFMMDNQDKYFNDYGFSFKNLFGRSLKLIDCQNLFCEVGKYARVSHPNIKDLSGRTRIKQMFNSSGELHTPAFPKKWDIDNCVEHFLKNNKQ